jgi:hypothetical protein
LGKRSADGKKKVNQKDIEVLRTQQTAIIGKILDGMNHFLPTIQDIFGSLWDRFPEKEKLSLKVLGRAVPFCDGVGVPRTAFTSNQRQIKDLF